MNSPHEDRRVSQSPADSDDSEGEARYRTLFEHAPDAIVVFDLDTGKFIEANENACRLFGLSRAQLLEVGPVDLSPARQPDGRSSTEAAAEFIGRTLAGDVPAFEWTHLDAAGNEIECEIRLVRMPPFSRFLVRGSMADIRERKAAQAELARREREFRTLAENSPDWIIRVDRELRRTYVNPALATASGLPAEELIGRRPSESFPDSPEMLLSEAAFRECFETGSASTLERNTDLGQPRVLQTSYVPERGEAGDIVSVLSITRDITSIRRALDAEVRLASIVGSANDAIMSSALDGTITSWNAGAERMFGYRAADVIGKTSAFLFEGEPDATRADIRDRVLAGETISDYVREWKTGGGRPVVTSSTFFPLRDAGGAVVGVASIARDLTEERATMKALEVSEERLRLALRTARMGSWSYDQAADRMEYSAEAAEIYRRPLDEMPRTMAESLALLHPDDQGLARSRVREGASSGDGNEYRILMPDGTYRWISGFGRPVSLDGKVFGITMDVHARKLQEEALRESEDRLRQVIETVSAGVWVWDGTSILLVNAALERMSGYNRLELLAEGGFERFVGAEQAAAMAERAAARLRGEDVRASYEITITHADGSQRYWELVAGGIDFRGSPALIISAFDITGRRASEEALRESEVRFRTVVNSAAVGMLLYDGAAVVEANPAAGAIFGFPPAKLTEPGFMATLVDDETRAIVRARGQARLRGEDVSPPFAARARHSSGREIHLQMNATTIDLDGHRASLVTVLDTTEQHLAEESLRESESRFRSLVDNSPDFITRIDADLRLEFVNRTAELQAGLDPAVVIGKRANELGAPPEIGALWLAQHRHVLETGEAVEYEYALPNVPKRGDIGYRRARLIPEMTPDGAVHHIFSVVTDVTAARVAADERRRLDQQMQHAQKLESLGVLAGGIAHDFNNLLVAILGNAGLALLELPPESPARQTVAAIEMAAQRAAELTRQMLAYSGKGRFIIEPLSLSRVVEEMAHLLEVSISKRAVLKYRFAPDVPTIEGDATQIRQVVMNLIINASDAIGERSGVISVSTGMLFADRDYLAGAYVDGDLTEGDYVFLEVADTGVGMDEETRARIFDPFFSTKFTGRGLGLAAVLGIVRGHRGAIKLYSEPGRGTTFKVLFPVSGATQAERPENKSALPAGAARRTVLVVDDDETVRAVTRRMLERAGFAVLLAADGAEGVRLYTETPAIDVVLLDMTMPRMDGEETFRELRRVRSDVRVILTSGYNEQDATERFAGKGLAGFIQKPYRPQELIEKITEGLS